MKAEHIAIVISLIAILVTVVGYVQNYASSAVSTRIANEANETSKKALKLSEFTHRKEICPDLVLDLHCTIPYAYKRPYYVRLKLKNKAWGQATVRWLRSGMTMISSIDSKVLKDNPKDNLGQILTKNESTEFEIELNLEMCAEFVPKGIETYSQKWIESVGDLLQEGSFYIEFEDEIGTTYNMEFRYNEETDSFIGEPRLVHEVLVEHRKKNKR